MWKQPQPVCKPTAYAQESLTEAHGRPDLTHGPWFTNLCSRRTKMWNTVLLQRFPTPEFLTFWSLHKSRKPRNKAVEKLRHANSSIRSPVLHESLSCKSLPDSKQATTINAARSGHSSPSSKVLCTNTDALSADHHWGNSDGPKRTQERGPLPSGIYQKDDSKVLCHQILLF